MKRMVRTGFALLLLAAAALAATGVYVYRASPPLSGDLVLPGLQAELRIERDAHGIPTIRAASMRDAMVGLGMVHAQDRLWQLETHRRIGSGRLAEAFGESALANDRFLRALGVHRAAAAQWAQAAGPAREALEAYALGVNTWVRQHMKARPPEMLLLGLQPQDWTPVDSLAWAIMMAWDLGGNWNSELLRLRLALQLPMARIDELMPPYPGDKPLLTADYSALMRSFKLDARLAQAGIDQLIAAAPPSGVEGEGSNNWALAGTRTLSGKPLLANDPHLKLSAPALWYFVRIEVPGLKVAGATMPGLPLVVLGQNEHVAWGFTNTGPDVQDLYIERIKPGDPGRYETPSGWAAFWQDEEVIKVKDKPDVRITVRATRHGPVISDAGVAADVLGAGAPAAHAIAMRWTALDLDNDMVGVGLNMEQAQSVDDFVAASSGWVAPMQNMLVADRNGSIGFVAAGRVPLRRPDNDLQGLVPAPGWDARYDWEEGFLPAPQTPREFDPPRGWLATANQRIHAPDYPHFITSEWALPYRQHRIEQMLAATPKHSLQSLQAMQADVLSLAAQRVLPWLQRAHSAHPLAGAAKQELAAFSGEMAAERAAPLIYWAWIHQLTRALFEDELGPLYEKSLGERSYRDALEGVLERNDGWWCDDKRSAVVETCASQIDGAFTRALQALQAEQGSDVSAWRWGTAHQARSEHRPFSRVSALARFFELRSPVGGDTYTVNVSRVRLNSDPTTGELFLDEHGPSLRALYDLGDLSQSRVMHSSGQSGLPWSSHYRNFVAPWSRVDYVPLWGQGAPVDTWVLRPGSPAGKE